jgi:hypothetical protein
MGARPPRIPAAGGRDLRLAIVAGALIVGAAAAALLLLGRRPWCACGSAVPWSWEIRSRHNSQHLLDPYTLTHVVHGIGFYAGLWLLARRRLSLAARAGLATALEAAWEVFENTEAVIRRYRADTISLDYYGDSVLNSAADVAACMLGFALAAKVPARISLAALVLVEGVLLLWVRDSFLLNVVMLIRPIDAVRDWQMGAVPAP